MAFRIDGTVFYDWMLRRIFGPRREKQEEAGENCILGSFGSCCRSGKFDTHGSVHRRLLSRNVNKMQLCNRIYYSKVF